MCDSEKSSKWEIGSIDLTKLLCVALTTRQQWWAHIDHEVSFDFESQRPALITRV